MIPPPREGRDHNGFCGGGYLNHMEPDITAFTRDEEIANQISRPGISNSEDLCCRRSLPFLPPPPALAPPFTPLRKLQYFTNQACSLRNITQAGQGAEKHHGYFQNGVRWCLQNVVQSNVFETNERTGSLHCP